MTKTSIKWNTKKALNQLNNIQDSVKSSSKKARMDAAKKIIQYANENIDIRSKMPKAWSWIRGEPSIEESWQIQERQDTVHIKNTSKHAFVVEYGHAMIFPKRARVLHWQDLSGEDIFTRYTRAVMPMHYFRDAMERAKREFKEDVVKSITKGLSYRRRIKV